MKNRTVKAGDNWETPEYIYDPLHEEFNFDFDPCPLNTGEITPENDGLLIPWGKCNFVNPPYTQDLKEAFIKRAYEETKKGNTSVLLIPSTTETAIFHDIIYPYAEEVRYLRRRIKFKGINTKGVYVTTNTGMSGSVIVVFKP